jgi:hypothetical protein
MQSFFTEFTAAKAAFYMTMLAYVSIAAIAVMAEPYLSLPCDEQVCKFFYVLYVERYSLVKIYEYDVDLYLPSSSSDNLAP